MRALIVCIGLGGIVFANACRPAGRAETACTMMGCSDGLVVQVDGAPQEAYTVALTLPDGSTREARCEAPNGCPEGLFFADVSAPQLAVRVVTRTGVTTAEVAASYEENRPNGPECLPVCRQARVRVTVAE